MSRDSWNFIVAMIMVLLIVFIICGTCNINITPELNSSDNDISIDNSSESGNTIKNNMLEGMDHDSKSINKIVCKNCSGSDVRRKFKRHKRYKRPKNPFNQ